MRTFLKWTGTNRQRRRVLKHIDRFYHNQVKPELRLWKKYFSTTGGLYYNDVGVIYDSSRYAFKIKLKKRPFNEHIS